LAQRLDSANQTLLELKRQIQTREPRDVIGKTAEKMEMLLGASGAHLSLWPIRPLALLAQEYLLRRFEAPHFRSKITPRLSSEFRGGRCGSEISGSAVRRCRAVCWTGHAGQFRKPRNFNPMSIPCLSDEARKAVSASFWRDVGLAHWDGQ
jgi:hypothetical protein